MLVRELVRELRAAGWRPVRSNGSHEVWTSPDDAQHFTLAPPNMGRDVSPNVRAAWRRAQRLQRAALTRKP